MKDILLELLIKVRPKYIKYYSSNNILTYIRLLKNNKKCEMTEEQIKKFLDVEDDDLDYSNIITLIRLRPEYIKYYTGSDISLYIEALKINKECEMTEEQIKKFANWSDYMKELVKVRPEYIKHYAGTDESVYKAAIDSGLKLTEENIRICSKSATIIMAAIKINPDYIKYYTGYDVSPYIEALKNNKEYKIPEEQIKRIASNPIKMTELVKVRPEYIKYYSGYDESVYKAAIDSGFKLTEEYIRIHSWSAVIIMEAIKINPDYIKYYTGYDVSPYIEALKNNKEYKIPEEQIKRIASNPIKMTELVKVRPEYIKYYTGYDVSPYIELLKNNKEYEMSEEQIRNFAHFSSDNMKELVKVRPEYIKYYTGTDESVYKAAIDSGFKLTEENIRIYSKSAVIIKEAIKINPEYVKYYTGTDESVYKAAIDSGFKLTEENIRICSKSAIIIMEAIKINPDYIKYYTGNDISPYIEALKNNKEYEMSEEQIRKIAKGVPEMIKLVRIRPNYIIYYDGNDGTVYQEAVNNGYKGFSEKIPWPVLKFYKGVPRDFINNYEKISKFLELLKIPESKFIQYALGLNYDWLEDIKKIIASNIEIEEFLKVKDYFFKNILEQASEENEVQIINNFLLILKNYNKYKNLCTSITTKEIKLTEDGKRKIIYLFSQNEQILTNDELKDINDFEKIVTKEKAKYESTLESSQDIETIKNVICMMMFNHNKKYLEYLLEKYGNTMELKRLAFIDRKSPLIKELVDDITIYTTMIEEMLLINDKDYLLKIAKRLLDNFELTIECSMMFNQMEEKMLVLYEYDTKRMLTKISKIKNYDKILDKEKSKKYGVDVIDFSDKEYTLLAHVKSPEETIEELLNGEATGAKNFISFSAISNRNQVYYSSRGTEIIFGYDDILEGHFIASSRTNMGSNGAIENNSSDVSNIRKIGFKQRGIKETSIGTNQNINPEHLAYREGLKPTCIILPGGRTPTEEEIEIAKKYGLKFVITQSKEQEIRNPKKIEFEEEKEEYESDKITKLKEIREKIIKLKSEKPKQRRIAIFSDVHGLYEPTLAILEDARKNGITEIYSLGDNIGTGPNPSEVLALLDEYNVQSLMGNHELYVIKGVAAFEEHLRRVNAYNEAESNSEWTRKQLTEAQKERIKLYPKTAELIIGGKKILLCHYIKNFNNDKLLVNPEEFDKVIQGHIHFEKNEGKVKTLSGAAIGSAGKGRAKYIVITEKPEGGYEIEEKEVEYNMESVYYDITESNLDDKEKIINWTGRGR